MRFLAGRRAVHPRLVLVAAAPAAALVLLLSLLTPAPGAASLRDPLLPLHDATADWATTSDGLLAQDLRGTAESVPRSQVRAAQERIVSVLAAAYLSPGSWDGAGLDKIRERLLVLHDDTFDQQFVLPLGTPERPSSRSLATALAAPFEPVGPARVTGSWEVLRDPARSDPPSEVLWFGFTVAHAVVDPDTGQSGVFVVQVSGDVPLVPGQEPTAAPLTLGVRHLGIDSCASTLTAIAPALDAEVQSHLWADYLSEPSVSPADLYGDRTGPPLLAQPDPMVVTGTCT